MSPSEKHPHIERPSEEQLLELVQAKAPALCDLYLSTHRLVLETVPDVLYSVDCKDAEIGYGARQYGYDGWGMASLAAYQRWVSLYFLRGAVLDDPEQLLEGSGRAMRHVKLRSLEQFAERKEALRHLLEQAASINRRY